MDGRTLLIILAVGITGMTVWGLASCTVTSEVVSAGNSRNPMAPWQAREQPKEKEKEAAASDSSQSNPILWVVIVGLALLLPVAYLAVQWKRESKPLPKDDAPWADQYMPPQTEPGAQPSTEN